MRNEGVITSTAYKKYCKKEGGWVLLYPYFFVLISSIFTQSQIMLKSALKERGVLTKA